MKNILILGASGFIGKQIAYSLESQSNCFIMLLEHKTKLSGFSDNVHIYKKSLSWINFNELPVIPDIIIHAARNSSARFGKLGRHIMSLKGRMANQMLLHKIKKLKVQPRLIYISGSLMYGSLPDYLIHENFPLRPISFAREYVSAEIPFIKELEKKNPNILMLRVPWVIGPGSWFYWTYLKYIEKNNKIPLYGEGNNIMTFIDVRNLANAVYKLCYLPHSGLLNLYNKEYMQQMEFAQLLNKILKKEIHKIDIGIRSNIDITLKEAFKSDIQLGSNFKELQEVLQENMYTIETTLKHFTSDFTKEEIFKENQLKV